MTTYTVSPRPEAYGSDCTPKQARLIALAFAAMIRKEFSGRELEIVFKDFETRPEPGPLTLEFEIDEWIESEEVAERACREGLRVASEYCADGELRGLTLEEIAELGLDWAQYFPLVDPETGICIRVAQQEEPGLILCDDFAVVAQETRTVETDGHAAGTTETATFCAWLGRGVVTDTNGEAHWTDASSLADTWRRWDNYDELWSN